MASAQSFSYAAINVLGAVATEARDINNNGEIVGWYKTAACTDYDNEAPSCNVKGFKIRERLLYQAHGSEQRFDGNPERKRPGRPSRLLQLGDLVGFYKKSDCTRRGFIWFHTNVVNTIDYPGTAHLQASTLRYRSVSTR
jgi:hypothetical protein